MPYDNEEPENDLVATRVCEGCDAVVKSYQLNEDGFCADCEIDNADYSDDDEDDDYEDEQ